MILNKDQIKNIDDLPSETFYLEEWGGEIKVRSMSTKDRIEFEKKNTACITELETMICLIIYSCVDEDNNKIFDDSDYDFLSNKSASALIKVFEKAVNLSTLSKKGLEQKAKNS